METPFLPFAAAGVARSPGLDDAGAAVAADELAADAWLAKPFHLAELYAAVARWTGRRARSA